MMMIHLDWQLFIEVAPLLYEIIEYHRVRRPFPARTVLIIPSFTTIERVEATAIETTSSSSPSSASTARPRTITRSVSSRASIRSRVSSSRTSRAIRAPTVKLSEICAMPPLRTITRPSTSRERRSTTRSFRTTSIDSRRIRSTAMWWTIRSST